MCIRDRVRLSLVHHFLADSPESSAFSQGITDPSPPRSISSDWRALSAILLFCVFGDAGLPRFNDLLMKTNAFESSVRFDNEIQRKVITTVGPTGNFFLFLFLSKDSPVSPHISISTNE
eukprot:TRINITY_DN11016_c0_g1_i4.p1 TRINITY_DN11016_c0_g1~~TRINITY_DN11016_c0_g1_i4.p1  ORF type:complete len:119 (+),score=22.99 TRINITY_DN11016_c0_g1_i4:64-420(+)